MLPAESIVVVGDDDMAYARTFIEDFACARLGLGLGGTFFEDFACAVATQPYPSPLTPNPHP